jgi:hypothetical protein
MIQPPSRLRPALLMVWRWFIDLSETRPYKKVTVPEQVMNIVNGMPQKGLGWRAIVEVERLAHQEIEAWARLSGVTLDVWHGVALTLMDAIYVHAANHPPVAAVKATKSNMMEFFKMFGMKAKAK